MTPRLRLFLALFAMFASLGPLVPARAAVSMGGVLASSPDDIAGFTSVTVPDSVVSVGLPFDFTVEGTVFKSVAISTNGWVEFGGNTWTDSDFVSSCLPTDRHTNPLLAVHWTRHDMVGPGMRYGTVGRAPNRTFIVDWQVKRTGVVSSSQLGFQLQLHEGANVAIVRFRDQQPNTNGQGASMGYQGAGGHLATTVLPISCNAKVMDDNRPNEGWSADLGVAGDVVLAAIMMSSPDDISTPVDLEGDEGVVETSMPFPVTIDGKDYSDVAISTNGWMEFGGNTASMSCDPADPHHEALPTAGHTNPFLAAYWANLVTVDSHVRYGTLGSAPNRVFFVETTAELSPAEPGGSDRLYFQVQVHEGSGLINVRYAATEPEATGKQTTIGFQGAGGAAAWAFPIGLDARTLDDNDAVHEGWSIQPLAMGGASLHALFAHSPDDITDFSDFDGRNQVAKASLLFPVVLDGKTYETVAISANGWLEFGENTWSDGDFVNDCLPTSRHTNPFVAAYWDELQPSVNGVRYRTVGTQPNRIFLVDWTASTVTEADNPAADDIAFQVQVHEGSNLINVKYHLARPEVNGQSATIGYQGAGGDMAIAWPLTCDGKILDDNRPIQGWSVSPRPDCGNGYAEPGEGCDDGDTTFKAGEYCDAMCLLLPCGKPTNSSGSLPKASDALFALRSAVGSATCDQRVCDVNDSGSVNVADALAILKASVGQNVTLTCPASV